MFFQRLLTPGTVERPEYDGGAIGDQRVAHALGQIHAPRQAAEHGRPVRGMLRLADQRHGPR